MMKTSRFVPVWAGLAAVLAAPASAQEFRSAYTVSYMGLPVASSDFTSRIEGDRFSIKGTLSSSGLASLFDTVTGKVNVSGGITKEGLRPREYRLSYETDSKKKSTTIRFDGGEVEDTTNDPPLRKRRGDWVKLKKKHLKSVADPLSATLIKATKPEDVCRRTLRLYDGETRANLVLSRAGTEEEWNGQRTETCKAEFEPVSGYKKSRRAIEYLRDESEITITFAQLGKTGVYAPVLASIGTQIGTITISASRVDGTN